LRQRKRKQKKQIRRNSRRGGQARRVVELKRRIYIICLNLRVLLFFFDMDIVTLLDWSRANGIRIHPSLRVLHNDKKGIYVRAASSPILPEQQSRKLLPSPSFTHQYLQPSAIFAPASWQRTTNRYVSAFLRRMSAVVVIPKSAVLSARSCTLADQIPHAPYGHDATLTLALALYSEQCVRFRQN